jgi:1,4-alpha-glucan branching enzyme
VDQFCGGRTDPNAFASARLWYAANVGAAGLPMMFMGTEMAQNGWWHADEWHRLNWDNAEDDIGEPRGGGGRHGDVPGQVGLFESCIGWSGVACFTW